MSLPALARGKPRHGFCRYRRLDAGTPEVFRYGPRGPVVLTGWDQLVDRHTEPHWGDLRCLERCNHLTFADRA